MKDEDYAVLLLQPLDTESAGPSRIDVAKAMRDGHRSRRMRTWSAGAALTAVAGSVTGGVLVLSPAAPAPQPVLPTAPVVPAACKAQVLPTDGAKSADVRGGDPTGTYLVGSTEPFYGGKNPSVLVWRDGKLVDKVPPKGPVPYMWAINGSGVAVGGTDGVGLPYFYRDGKVSRLKGYGRAMAINEAGMIAGTHEKGGESVPQRWASPDAEPELIKPPAGYTAGRARDIDEDGTIVVTLFGTASEDVALWHPDGSVEILEKLKGDGKTNYGMQPIAFHYGWLYGETRRHAGPSAGPMRGTSSSVYRYHVPTGTTQLVNESASAAQVPAQGGSGGFMDRVPRVYVGREILELPALVESNDDGFELGVVSEDATVVAGTRQSSTATESNGPEPVMWRCR